MRLRFLFIFAIYFLPFGAQAQRAEVWGIGGFLGVGFTNNSAVFSTLPGIPPAGGQPNTPYSNGSFLSNIGFQGGVFFNFPFLKDFSFRPAFGYEYLPAQLQAETNTFTLINGARTPIVITHTVDGVFKTWPVSLSLFYNMFNNISAGLSGEAAFVTSARYRKSRQITEPAEIGFLDGGSERTDFDGELAGKSEVRFGVSGIIQFPFKIKSNFLLKPELSYTYSLSDVAENVSWQTSPVRFSLAGEYAFLAPKEFLKDTIILRDTTLQLVAFNAADTTILLKTDFRDSTAEDESYIYTTTFQQEFYTRFTPKPAPLLLGDMRVRFLKGGVETETITLMVEDSVVRRTIVTQDLTRYEYDTLHFTQFPHVIFYPEITSEAGIASWEIVAMQNGNLLKTFRGEGNPPPSVDWDFSAEADPVKIAQQPIDYTFSVTDREAQMAEAQRGKIIFKLEKKLNLPGAQLPVMREEFYFSKAISETMTITPFKKRVLKTAKSKMFVGTQSEVAIARLLAGILKISDKNIAVTELPERFKNMIAVYLYP